MRICPRCSKSYEDDALTFCTEDGTHLVGADATTPGSSIAHTRPVEREHGPALHTATDFPAPIDPLMEGAQVGEYLVGRKIGEGGMGQIFSGVHPVIGKKVALKVLNREMASSPEIVQRFILEAKSVNQIGHRNIVDIFSFGKLTDGRQYFAMEFLEGQSLASRLASEEPVPWNDAIQIWIQVAAAIDAAHGKGIVHRDLKPDNVYITPSPEGPFVKVLDFGIAKLLGDTPGLQKTGTGVPIGTPAYMSPEQASGTKIDHRTDLYAYGIILYETICGRPPFAHHTSFVTLLTAHLNEAPPPLSSMVDIHPELNHLVEQLLAKDPADRPADMTTVRTELVRLRDLAVHERTPLFAPKGEMGKLALEEQKTSQRVAASDKLTRPQSIAPVPQANRSPLLLAVAAAVLLVGGGGAFLALQGKPAPPPAVVTAAARVDPPPVAPAALVAPSAIPADKARIDISTNGVAVKVYVDDSEKEHSATVAAEGTIGLKVLIPANTKKWLRVEAEGYKPLAVGVGPLTGGEFTPWLATMIQVEQPRHGAGGGHGTRPPATGGTTPGTTSPGTKPTNGNIINPFD